MKKRPWYHRGLQFECTACGNCCSGEPGYVWLDVDEMEPLAQSLMISIEELCQQYIRRVGSRYSLKEFPDGDCILLDPVTRHCRAYEARPVQCRTWPFWSSNLQTPADWQATCQVCPGAGQGHLYTLDQIEVERKQKEQL